MKKNIISLILLAILFAVGCAKPEKVTPNEGAKKTLDAWLFMNYRDLAPTGRGIYVIEDMQGSGSVYDGQPYIYVDYTIKDLDGSVLNSSDAEINKREGTYKTENYYGPTVMLAEGNSVTVGVQDMLVGMKVGGIRTAVIPSWLMTYTRYKKDSEYIKNTTSSPTVLYSIKFREAIDDIAKWESDSLKRYVNNNYPGLDTLSYGFYLKKVKESDSEVTVPTDTTLKIRYVGRLLNGTVFDTNDADSAKFYGIYSKSGTYGLAEVTMAETEDELSMKFAVSSESSSDLCAGFKKTVMNLKPGEKGIGMFVSGFGYKANGSGDKIPPYSPLIFQIDIE